MQRVKLHASGPEVSGLVWGSMRCESQFASSAELAEHLRWLLDQGITTIDTANTYGAPDPYTVEEFLGQALAEVGRERFEIVTKCGIQRVSPHRHENRVRHFDFSAQEIRRSVERSLAKLGIERIDLLLLHRPDFLMEPDETAGELDRLVAEGKVAHLGVSNMKPARMDLLATYLKAPLVTNQIEFSPRHLDPLHDGTFDHAMKLGHRPMFWSPVGGGALMRGEDETSARLRDTLSRIASENGLGGPADAAFAFVARHPVGGVPVIGSGQRERIDGAIRAMDTVLDRQEWYAIMTEVHPSLHY